MRTLCFSVVMGLLLWTSSAWAWNDSLTHPALTQRAISASAIDDYMRNQLNLADGLDTNLDGMIARQIIELGSKLEDDPSCRASNHFHNPYLDWQEAGLTDTLWLVDLYCLFFSSYAPSTVVSNLTWATGFTATDPSVYDEAARSANEMDWASAREYFLIYLTGKNFQGETVASSLLARNQNLGKALRALGQVSHLLQDTAVPAHVRDDFAQGHTMVVQQSNEWPWKWIGNGLEIYLKGKEDWPWFNQATSLNSTDPMLTDFWDTDQFTGSNPGVDQASLGLSEFTSINFLSEYTKFSPDFPYPSRDDCEVVLRTPLNLDGPLLDRQYISSTNGHPGTQVDHLAVISYADFFRRTHFPTISSDPLPIGMDDRVYEDYASFLIPRAIGYSADLMDYFFRGELEVQATPFFFDSYGSTPNQLYNIFVKIKNLTSGEALTDGYFTLHYRYDDNGTMVYGDALCGTTQCGEQCYTAVASGEMNENDEKVIQFYFPGDNGLTTDMFDQIEWTLVFRGTLGHEENAVVAKVFPDADQQVNNWGNILLNEEWETLAGYPESGFGHGSCWRDAGLAGYHTIDSSYGGLYNYMVRVANYSTLPAGCATVARPDPGIPVTENTWLQFLISTLQDNPIRSNGKDKQHQHLELVFSNGASIYFYDGDLDYWPNDDPNDPNHAFVPIISGYYSVQNLFSILEGHGISTSGSITLDEIMFWQHLDEVIPAPDLNQVLHMWINSIRLVETDPGFFLCQ